MLIALSVLLIFTASTFSRDFQQFIYDYNEKLPTKIQDNLDKKIEVPEKKPLVENNTLLEQSSENDEKPKEKSVKPIEPIEKERQTTPDHKQSLNEQSVETPKNKMTRILLVGLDKRQGEDGRGRADAIIVVSMNNSKKTIHLISFMRDTYVSIPGYKKNKINTAYSLGGIDLLKDTLYKNFKLNVDHHVVVNFIGFEKMINTLGGVQVTVKDYEVKELNRCLDDIKKGPGNYIHESGPIVLNGAQTLAYVRMRKVGDGDYERTQRQRVVMQRMIEKSKDISLFKYPILIANLLPSVRTNVSIGDSLSLLKDYYAIKNWTINGAQIPTAESGQPKMIGPMWVIDPNKKKCTKMINDMLE